MPPPPSQGSPPSYRCGEGPLLRTRVTSQAGLQDPECVTSAKQFTHAQVLGIRTWASRGLAFCLLPILSLPAEDRALSEDCSSFAAMYLRVPGCAPFHGSQRHLPLLGGSWFLPGSSRRTDFVLLSGRLTHWDGWGQTKGRPHLRPLVVIPHTPPMGHQGPRPHHTQRPQELPPTPRPRPHTWPIALEPSSHLQRFSQT